MSIQPPYSPDTPWYCLFSYILVGLVLRPRTLGDSPGSDQRYLQSSASDAGQCQRQGCAESSRHTIFYLLIFDCGPFPFLWISSSKEWSWFYPWVRIPTISKEIRYSLTTQLCYFRGPVKHYSFWKQLNQTWESVADIASLGSENSIWVKCIVSSRLDCS